MTNFLNQHKKNGFEDFRQLIAEKESYGFLSLIPVFDHGDQEKLDSFKEFKEAQQKYFHGKREKNFPSLSRTVDESEIDFENDELIADQFFASLLNRRREIEVEGIIYKYTEQGVFYAPIGDYQSLLDLSEKDHSSLARGSYSSQNVGLFKPELVKPPMEEPCPDCGGGGGGYIPPKPQPTKFEVKQNLKVCFWDSNIWDDIFGPAEDCLDYFESDKRIKTKVWAQNYFLFSSTGVKVESQNRFLRIWWAENIDEVEVGYTLTAFEYPVPENVWPSTNKLTWTYEYNGFIIDNFGRYVGPAGKGPRALFDRFPIEDEDTRLITIYLAQPLSDIVGSSTIDLTNKDINNKIEEFVKSSFSTLSNYLKTNINGSATIVYPESPTKLVFLSTDWSSNNKNDNKISNTFDWNTAQIGFSKTGSGSATPIYNAPKSYTKFTTITYGMGRRGNTWKGSKVVLNDTK